jgi:hypothetical protein
LKVAELPSKTSRRLLSTDFEIPQLKVRVKAAVAVLLTARSLASDPFSARPALADGFLLTALSVALSLPPVGLYRTVTVHDFLGPRLVPLHRSAVIVNAPGDGEIEITRALVAEPPEFVSVNVCDTPADWPAKSKVPVLVVGDHASCGGLLDAFARRNQQHPHHKRKHRARNRPRPHRTPLPLPPRGAEPSTCAPELTDAAILLPTTKLCHPFADANL